MLRFALGVVRPLCTLLLVLVMTVPPTASGQDEPGRFLPPERDVQAMLQEINLIAERFPLDRGEWDESAGYTVPDEHGRVLYTLVMYAVTRRSPQEARDLYVSRTRQLELDNEVTHSWNTPKVEALGMDDSRDFRLVYVDAASRSRSGEYARLVRSGSTVALVEVVGAPESDDEGVIDRDRLGVMLGATQLVARRMVDNPIVPSNNALQRESLIGLTRLRLPSIQISPRELLSESIEALQRLGDVRLSLFGDRLGWVS